MLKTFLAAVAVLFIQFSYSQSVPEKIVAALDSFSFLRPQEKTYLQTDKNTYASGETIWFKAYAVLENKPTVLSKVIYADLKDAAGRLVEKRMLPLTNGTASGSFELKEQLAGGNYYLHCYTLWMLNFPQFISEKKITIIRPGGTAKQTGASNSNSSISFLPEGGNLITGLKSIIAFKAIDAFNNPVAVSGDIVDEKNTKLVSFSSTHDGMGSFELLPAEGASYKAVLQVNGVQKTITLPAAKKEGITLSVDNSNANKTFVKVERSETNKSRYNNLLVMAQINYQLAYMGKLNIDEGQDAVAINKKTLPPGIMQITVLTEQGIPLAERIVFVANHTISNSLLQTIAVSTEKRKKNSLELDIHEFPGLQGAVAVINYDADIAPHQQSIQSALLLTDDIHGRIHEPGYYFKDKEVQTIQHLDLVMLTNGWRRFALQEIMANQFPALQYPFETGLSVSGKVLQSDGKSTLKTGKINLIIKGEDSTNIMSQAATNEHSVFVVDNIAFKKEATIYYQGTNTAKENAIVDVKINPAYFDTLKTAPPAAAENYPAQGMAAPYLQNLISERQRLDSSKGKTLQEVVVRTKKRSAADSLNLLYTTDMFYNSDQTLVLDENMHYNDIWQYLRMMVPGISIITTDFVTQVNFTRFQGLDFFSENSGENKGVQFFLNEVPVSLSIVESLDPTDIALVKIYKGTTGIALGAERGAIGLYTVKGKSTRDWRQKGFDFFKKQGYSVGREFYAVDYSKLNPESAFSDVRATLYWNPDIKVKDGKVLIEFYNDDAAKKFKLVAEGIDQNGRLLHVEKLIQ